MMAEYIEREAVLAEMTSKPLPNDAPHLYLAMRGIVRKALTADVVEVVRCKDCEYAEANGGDCNSTLPITYRNYICEVNETKYITLEHCSYGKRKEGAEE